MLPFVPLSVALVIVGATFSTVTFRELERLRVVFRLFDPRPNELFSTTLIGMASLNDTV